MRGSKTELLAYPGFSVNKLHFTLNTASDPHQSAAEEVSSYDFLEGLMGSRESFPPPPLVKRERGTFSILRHLCLHGGRRSPGQKPMKTLCSHQNKTKVPKQSDK